MILDLPKDLYIELQKHLTNASFVSLKQTCKHLNQSIVINKRVLRLTNWNAISLTKMTEDFMFKYRKFINWRFACSVNKFSKNFVEKIYNKELHKKEERIYVHLHDLVINQSLDKDFIEKHIDEIKLLRAWKYSSQKLPEEILIKYFGDANESIILSRQQLSEEFMKKHIQIHLHQLYVSRYQKISEEFIEENISIGNINHIQNLIKYQKLSSQFVDKCIKSLSSPIKIISLAYVYQNTEPKNYKLDIIDLDWQVISSQKKLSEDFIEKHRGYVFWDIIMKRNSVMSGKFIEKYMCEFGNANRIIKNRRCDTWFIEKYYKQTSLEEIIKFNIDNLTQDLFEKIIIYENINLRKVEEYTMLEICSNITFNKKFISKYLLGVIEPGIIIKSQCLDEEMIIAVKKEMEICINKNPGKNKFMTGWSSILTTQHLSQEFIEEHFEEIKIKDLEYLCICQTLSQEFLIKHINEILKEISVETLLVRQYIGEKLGKILNGYKNEKLK